VRESWFSCGPRGCARSSTRCGSLAACSSPCCSPTTKPSMRSSPAPRSPTRRWCSPPRRRISTISALSSGARRPRSILISRGGSLIGDPEVLKKDPRRFAVPPTAHAYGREFAQLYTDLAGMAENEWLAATFAGAAFHHIEDVCNQIHTVQVGIYEFFESAFLQ